MEREVRVLSDVKDLSELIDGASVDGARVIPQGGQLSLELDLTRACPELQAANRRGVFSRPKTPWVKSRLMLQRIAEIAVQRIVEAAPSQAPLLSCESVPGGYRLIVESPDGLRLSLTLDQLEGHFADVGAPMASP
ncbi:MAG: hypothetical protein HYZ91_02365 [Candidatus Omnitrophica bacterium]|nr:hypothetical protein [Candidatus Omnitrophota bacterium]